MITGCLQNLKKPLKVMKIKGANTINNNKTPIFAVIIVNINCQSYCWQFISNFKHHWVFLINSSFAPYAVQDDSMTTTSNQDVAPTAGSCFTSMRLQPVLQSSPTRPANCL